MTENTPALKAERLIFATIYQEDDLEALFTISQRPGGQNTFYPGAP